MLVQVTDISILNNFYRKLPVWFEETTPEHVLNGDSIKREAGTGTYVLPENPDSYVL